MLNKCDKIGFRIPRGYFAYIKVEGFKGSVLVDNTRDVDLPVITVEPREDCDKQTFVMTQKEGPPPAPPQITSDLERGEIPGEING